MNNRLHSFLALPLLLLSPSIMRADTITPFNVKGTAKNVTSGKLGSCAAGATCHFSGTLTVDVTSTPTNPLGTVDGLDITFPGLSAFDIVTIQGPLPFPGWDLVATNSGSDDLAFTFTRTPAVLVGFTGGTITGSFVGQSHEVLYHDFSRTILPTPEPSSLVPLAGGLSCSCLPWHGGE